MDRLVYIIHRSEIVQNGLAELLCKNFRCTVKLLSIKDDFDAFIDEQAQPNAILFIDEGIENKKNIQSFIQASVSFTFTIINHFSDNENRDSATIYLDDSEEKIFQKVKEAFEHELSANKEQEGLSNREIEVLKLLALGHSNKEIASKLFISTHTVISHRKNMSEKLGIRSVSGLTVYAIINDYIDTSNINLNDLI